MRAASRFVVPLGAIALGSALVAASTNVSSITPRIFIFLSLAPFSVWSERCADVSGPSVGLLKWIFIKPIKKLNTRSNQIVT